MPTSDPAIHPRRQRGFTLVEMLVVIGIITILISLLFPIYAKARLTGYVVSTRQEIENLSNAIMRYRSDMPSAAYPGPFSNTQIEKGLVKFSSGDTSGNTPTMSENLVLGLEGGLTSATATSAVFDPTQVGMGPQSLNANYPKRYPSFMDSTPWYTAWSNGGKTLLTDTHATGYGAGRFITSDQNPNPANDTDVPEYLDMFPDPLPILYLRARPGGAGVISYAAKGEAPAGPTGLAIQYEYDLGQITAYTRAAIGWGSPPIQGLQDLGSFSSSGTIDSNFPNNAGLYFLNQKIVPSNLSYIQQTGSPRQVDQFILIAAGRPRYYNGAWVRQYGTEYDICNFGNVMQ